MFVVLSDRQIFLSAIYIVANTFILHDLSYFSSLLLSLPLYFKTKQQKRLRDVLFAAIRQYFKIYNESKMMFITSLLMIASDFLCTTMTYTDDCPLSISYVSVWNCANHEYNWSNDSSIGTS